MRQGTRDVLRRFKPDLFRSAAGFRRDRSGATAVEFALVAMPFFAILLAIMQTSIVLFANQALQTMTSDASRKIMTGQLKGKTIDDFKALVCDPAAPTFLFDCSKIFLQVESFEDFSAAHPTDFVNPDCFDPEKAKDVNCYNPGGAEDVVIVRVVYPWPFGVSLADLGKPQLLVAVAAFQSEPY